MKICLAAVFCCIFLSHYILQAAHALERGPTGTIRVGIFQLQPLNYFDEHGVAQGFNPDLLREIVRDESWDIRFSPCDWAECLEKLQSEEIDLMVSVAYTSERNEIMDYSYEPVAEIWGQIFFRSQNFFDNVEQLAGRKVAIMRKDINGENFKKIVNQLGVNCTFVEFPDHHDVFAAVQEGAADAGVAPQHFGLHNSEHYNLVGSSIIFSPLSVYYATKKGRHHELLSHIDAHLAGWKNNSKSFYYDRLNHWLGVQQAKPVVLLKYIYIVALSAIAVIGLLMLWLKTLKSQVALRTTELHVTLEKYRVIFETFPMGITIIDPAGKILEVNKASEKLLGVTSNEHTSRSLSNGEWRIIGKDGNILESEQYPASIALRKNSIVRDREIGVAKPDGTTVWISVTASPIPLEGFGVAVCYSDISSRVEAEKQSELSEKRYRDIFENAPLGVFLADKNLNIFDANPRASQITGFSHKEICGFNVKDIVHHTSLKETPPEKAGADSLAQGVVVYERLLNTVGQDPVPVEVSLLVSPETGIHTAIFQDITARKEAEERIRNHQGQLEKEVRERTLELSEEIHERKQIEQALSDSVDRIQDIVETVSDWFWEMDEELRFTFLSDSFFIATELQREDIIGKTRWEFAGLTTVAEEPEMWRKHREDLRQRKRIENFEYISRAGDGVKWFRVNGKPLFDGSGEFLGYRGATADITKHKETEIALRASESKFRQIVEGVGDDYCFYSLNGKGCFTFLSPSISNWFGVTQEGLLGLTWDWIIELDSRSKQSINNANSRCLEGVTPKPYLIKTTSDYGSAAYEISQRPVWNDKGEVVEIDGIVKDISLQYQTAEALKKAKIKAEEAADAKSEFLANMSHEIRTPLNAVTGFSELLSTMVSDPKQKKYLEAIKTAGGSLLTLINDILDLSKIEASMVTIRYGPVLLREIFREIEQIFREKVDRKSIAFSTKIDPELPDTLIIDETRVRQVLLNLVGNSVKFTEKGFIEISANLRGFSGRANQLDMSITVQDSGVGISEASIKTIFEPFKQQETPDSRTYGGTGLGLAICKRLVEAMDGQISLNSFPRKGSTFEVRLNNVGYLPGKREPVVPEHQRYIRRVEFSPATVMIVDDVDSNRNLLKEILSRHNLEVITAVNGLEALTLAAENVIDLVLMDIRMPVMDGFAANKELKKRVETRDIPVVVLTASTNQDDHDSFEKHGFAGYLTKPISLNALIEELTRRLPYRSVSGANGEGPGEPKSTEGVIIPDGLAEILNKRLLPASRAILQTLIMDDASEFADEVRGLGEKYGVEVLTKFGEELDGSVQAFDISDVKEKLSQFQHVVTLLMGRRSINE